MHILRKYSISANYNIMAERDIMADPKEGTSADSPPIKKTSENHSGFAGLFHYADKIDYILFIFALLGSIANGAALPALTFLIAATTSLFSTWDAATQDANLTQLNQYAAYYVYAAIGIGIVAAVGIYGFSYMSARLTTKFQQEIFASVFKKDMAYIEEFGGADILSSYIISNSKIIHDAIGQHFEKLVRYTSMFVAGYAIAFTKGWKLTLVLMSTIPAFFLIGAVIAVLTRSLTAEISAARAKTLSGVVEMVREMKTVHSCCGEETSLKRCMDSVNTERVLGRQVGFSKGIIAGSSFFITFGAYALALWYGGQLIGDGQSAESVINVLFSSILAASSLSLIAISVVPLIQGIQTSSQYHQFMGQGDEAPGLKRVENFTGTIDFTNIKFAYPSKPEVTVLNDFNLSIKPGSKVAVVGESGSGKSTLFALLMKIYKPNGGSVFVDGINISDINTSWLRDNIGFVQQEPVLFSGTILENILMMRPDASKEEAIEAAKLANAHEFISKLPHGYETEIGGFAAQLSGGQKQRVAIARTLVTNPSFLLLDEATSALDTKSERVVQKALETALSGRTSITIAHRLSTIVDSDVIVVVNKGQVIESGNHKNLLQSGGAYAKMAKTQGIDGGKRAKKDHVPDEMESEMDMLPAKSSLFGWSVGYSFLQTNESRSGLVGTIQKFLKVLQDTVNKKHKSSDETKSSGVVDIFTQANGLGIWYIILIALFCAICSGSTMPAYGYVLGKVTVVMYAAEYYFSENVSDINMYAGIVAGLGGVAFFGYLGNMFSSTIVADNVICSTRGVIFDCLLAHAQEFFERPGNSVGEVSALALSDSTSLMYIFGSTMGLVLSYLAMIVASFVFAFIASWNLAIVILAVMPLIVIQMFGTIAWSKRFQAEVSAGTEKAVKVAIESLFNMKTAFALNASPHFIDKFTISMKSVLKSSQKLALLESTSYGIGQFIVYSTYGLAFYYSGVLIKQNKLDPDDVLQVFFPIFMAIFSMGAIQSFFPDISKGKSAANKISQFLSDEPTIDNGSDEGLIPLSCSSTLTIKNVCFSYPFRPGVVALNDFCLNVHTGAKIALVGESGSGKSTLIGLLQRFYDPSSGEIFLDDHNIKDINIRWLRRQFGLVGQEPALFSVSIRDNIAYGVEDADEERIISAAKLANAHEFIINNTADGYDTIIGAGGVLLSGGQKQRIAIARALLKDPSILLLDEPTSALDSQSEQEVTTALAAFSGKTMITVAHKLITIRDADVICVMQDGAIIQRGTHSSLSKQQGLYRDMLDIQGIQ